MMPSEKLDLFNQSVARCVYGSAPTPLMSFSTHPRLPEEQSTEWIAKMNEWMPAAREQLLADITRNRHRFSVGMSEAYKHIKQVSNKKSN